MDGWKTIFFLKWSLFSGQSFIFRWGFHVLPFVWIPVVAARCQHPLIVILGAYSRDKLVKEASFIFFPKDRWNLTLIHDTSPNEIFLEGQFFLLRFIHKFTLQKHAVFPHDVFHKFTNYLTSWGSPWKLLEEKISSDSNPYYKIKVSLRVGIWWNAWKKVQHVCLVFHFHLVWGENRELFQLSFKNIVPSRKLTYPTLGKGNSSTQNCLGNGYVSSC